MYCSKCGNEIKEGEDFCTQCGNACTVQKHNERAFNYENMNQSSTSNEYTANNTNNSMALGGLICSVIGLFIYGIPLGIISLILGIIAHKQAVINRSSTKMATWAIILGTLDIIIPIIIIDSWLSLIF